MIENLNTWSENFAINTDARIGIIRKPDVPKASEIGKNRSPASIPKRARTKKGKYKFKKLIVEFAKKFPNLKFSFECELPIEGLYDILELSDNFYVTYDTGNITSYGLQHEKYIDAFYQKINKCIKM